MWKRVNKPCEDEKVLEMASEYYKYRLEEIKGKGYEHEFVINNRVGVGLSDYYQICSQGQLNIAVPRYSTVNSVKKILTKYRILMDENGKPLTKRKKNALERTIPQDFLTTEGRVKRGKELLDAIIHRVVLTAQQDLPTFIRERLVNKIRIREGQ